MPDYLLCAAVLIAVQDHGRRLHIWSGGMPAQVIFDETSRVESFLQSRHMALGALTNAEFEDSVVSIDLRQGQRILCFTDGVTETANARNELFGEENLLTALESTSESGIIERITETLYQFVDDGKLSDDVTIFCFDNAEYSGIPEPLTSAEKSIEVDGFHWRTQFQLDPPQLRNESPLELIFSTLPAHPIVRAARADISFILNELFVNALDHGLLRLESAIKEQEDGLLEYFSQREARLAALDNGHIDIDINCEVTDGIGSFVIRCADSGLGFDFVAALEITEEDWLNSGRGLRTIAAMCDSLEANESGNSITVLYRWPRDNTKIATH